MTEHEHGGHRERMRARYAQNGLEGFAPHEALELLLFYAIPRRNVNPLAHRLIRHFGSLAAVLEASPVELMQVEGIGETAATLLSTVLPLARYAQQERVSDAVITTYKDAKTYCRHLFSGRSDEVLYVICLDAQGRVLQAAPAITGTIDEIVIYPRTIVEVALRHRAHGVVLAHNHPSGISDPSDADLVTTDILQSALAAVDIALLDHVIYADGECTSITQWRKLHITPAIEPLATPKAAEPKRTRKRNDEA